MKANSEPMSVSPAEEGTRPLAAPADTVQAPTETALSPIIASAREIPNPLSEQPDFEVPPALVKEIDEVVTHYPRKRGASLMLLHAFQERFGYVSRQAVEWIAARLELQ